MKPLKAVIFIFSFLLLVSSQTTLYAQSWKELDSLGQTFLKERNYEKALTIFTQAKIQAEKEFGVKHENYAFTLGNLGFTHQMKYNYIEAELLYIQAKETLLNIFGNENQRYISALNDLAILYRLKTDYAKAEVLLIEAKNLMEKAVGKTHLSYAASLNNLAEVYGLRGLYFKAESHYIEAIEIKLKANGKEKLDYIISLNGLASIYYLQRLYTKAEPLYLEGKETIAKILGKEHPYYLSSLNNLATIYEKQGKFSQAEPLHIEVLNTKEKILGKEHISYALSLNNLANTYLNQKNYAKAEFSFLEAIDIYKKLLGASHADYQRPVFNLAVLYDIWGQYAKAEPLYIENIKFKISELHNNFFNLSENEKRQYVSTNQMYFNSFYFFLTNVIANQSSYPSLPSLLQTALNLQLQTKGLLLSETSKMKKRILASGDTSLVAKFESWQAVKNNISKAYNMPIADREKKGIDIGKLENEANEVERGLSARSEDFKEAFNPPTYTYQNIQQKLGEGEVAIEMIRTEYKNQETNKADTAYLALIATSKEIKPVLLKNAKQMEGDLFGSYRRNISLNREDKESYGVFWAEIAKAVGTTPLRIYFSPDGIYHSINLNTLQNPETGKYLLEEFDIRIVTNLKEILEERKPSTQKTASLFGRPAYSMSKQDYEKSVTGLRGSGSEQSSPNVLATQKSWTDLTYTEVEIKNIRKLLKKKKWKIDAALGQEALEERVKKVKNPTILHLATHGYFTPTDSKNTTNNMLSSGIVLAGVNTIDKGENSDDGILTALEATNMDLDQTDLVVLSACETGLGEVAIGEGIYGLQRGFKVAGAKTIMMSLWSVDDAKTQEVMNVFYENWLGGSSKREAFKQAQLLMKTKYKNPAFWGGFVMIGD